MGLRRPGSVVGGPAEDWVAAEGETGAQARLGALKMAREAGLWLASARESEKQVFLGYEKPQRRHGRVAS